MKKYLGLAFLMAGVSLLAACGDDDSSSSADEGGASGGIASVATYEDLAHCTKSHYGEVAYVEEEDAYFECTSEDWVEVDSAKVDSILATSSSSESSSDTAESSSSVKADSSEIAEVETKKVDSVAVSGFAQKGPFASGTAVTVFGLDSALEMTKTKFTGKVSGDSGAFKVEKIVLPSQFALVQASGFYANEVTGKNTSGTKTTLNAIVDLSEGKNVKANVNLFTELEYARVKHLVLKENFNVPAAKKRATKELLAVFGAKAGDDLTATSLSLADTGAAGKALLAASILLQGDLSVSKFGLRLGEVGDLFASTGSLNSDTLRADLADWASKADSVDGFASIRTNVKNMKLVATVPDFESVIYAFWTGVYKLGACTDSLEETIKKNENKLSDNYGVGYACTSKRWHKSTALDTDLGLCTAKKEGSFEERKQEKKDAEYYVCKAGTWNKITATQFELKECTEKRNNEYVKSKSGEYFVCTNKQWLEVDALTYELKLCTESRNLEIAVTEKSGSYVCEWSDGEGTWRKATDVEAELGVCGAKSVKADTIYKTKGGDYYQCATGEWKKSDQLSFELQKAGECSAEKDLTTFETQNLGLYVCDNKEWRKAKELETKLGVCGDKNNENNSFKQDGDSYYVCLDKEWNETDASSYELKKLCTETNNGAREKSDEDHYFACQKEGNDYKWTSINELVYELGFCTADNDSTVEKTGNDKYYACLAGEWEPSDAVVYQLGFCTKSKDSTFEKMSNKYYVCKNKEWTSVTQLDYYFKKVCDTKTLYQRMEYSEGNYYECHSKGWEPIETFVDDRSGIVYKMVTIKGTVWMGDDLKLDLGEGLEYGFTWGQATKNCPDGWELPHRDVLTSINGSALCKTTTEGCTDSLGLSAVNGREYWSSDKSSNGYAYTYKIEKGKNVYVPTNNGREVDVGRYVRCIKKKN